MGIEVGVEEERLARAEMGGWDGMASVGWSGLCLDSRWGSSEGEENPMADSSCRACPCVPHGEPRE